MSKVEIELRRIIEELGFDKKYKVHYNVHSHTFRIGLETLEAKKFRGGGIFADMDIEYNWYISTGEAPGSFCTESPDELQEFVDHMQDLTSLLRELQNQEPAISNASPEVVK